MNAPELVAVPRPAASVLLVREGTTARAPIEVYMIRRNKSMRFLGGYYAFPGGKVDAADSHAAAIARVHGIDPVQAAMSADLYGGNVPYSINETPVSDRLSFYFRSRCFITVPDEEDSRAVSDDMRVEGCTQPD